MSKMNSLQIAITEAAIRRLSGDTYFKRGVNYFRRELVEDLLQTGDTLTATVAGTEDYEVRLSAIGKRITHFCSCPLGEEGEFCKHLVATALAWLAERATQAEPHKNVRAALQMLDKDALIELILGLSSSDEALRNPLLNIAGTKRSPKDAIRDVDTSLQAAIQVGNRDYDRIPGYAERVHAALDGVDALLKEGHGAAVIDICEEAYSLLSVVGGGIEDSDGIISDLTQRVAEMHLQACEQAPPNPEQLGARLFALELSSVSGEWYDAANVYAHLLGEAGRAAFQREAEKVWDKVPARSGRGISVEDIPHHRIQRMMESFARQSGDVEQLVAVLKRDLSTANRYLCIAEEYLKVGKPDDALRWVERGMGAFPHFEGRSLRIFAAEQYRRNHRHAEALHLVWADFRASPQLDGYRRLEEFARDADDWENPDGWRNRAMTHMRRTSADEPAKSSRQPAVSAGWHERLGSLLVEVLLYEGDNEQAWQEAQTRSCGIDLWLELAAERAKTHPEDAVRVYLRFGEKAIDTASYSRYEPAIALFERAAALMHGLGRSQEFQNHFDAIRIRHKAKSSLRKLIDARRSSLYLN